MLPDIEIARAAKTVPIPTIAAKLGIPEHALHPFGKQIAKIDHGFAASLEGRPQGKLILVTAISPTPAGEGKTTTTVGLGDALARIGKRVAICLREPSLGPCFGMKGGAAGGGYAQVVPMENINLHFTGDFHAIGVAHNLLAAMLDNHVYWGNDLGIDARRIALRRVVDMNDRALRQIVSSLGGVANGFPREDGFDITVASEVMAIFCLSRNLDDLEVRLSRIIGAYTRDRQPVTAKMLDAHGAMTVLLKDALQPNLVQSLEGTPAFVHGGPFANIAHGCNSIIATRTALGLADYVVTEAGFGADLGAEKFFDIKCRSAGLKPSAAVLVATARALKMHGGVARGDLAKEDLAALEKGFSNLERHAGNIRKFGVPAIIGINRFDSDSDAEMELLLGLCKDRLGIEAHVATHFSDGSAGSESLARAVAALVDKEPAGGPAFKPLYPSAMGLVEKIETIAKEIYGASAITLEGRAASAIESFEELGYRDLPVCIAKTQYSFSTDPNLRGAPSGHVLPVRDARMLAGAGFVVAICGDIMTMPGLPRRPAAMHIKLNDSGDVEGLF
jgi:formate--tetrahydrofolate ligase